MSVHSCYINFEKNSENGHRLLSHKPLLIIKWATGVCGSCSLGIAGATGSMAGVRAGGIFFVIVADMFNPACFDPITILKEWREADVVACKSLTFAYTFGR